MLVDAVWYHDDEAIRPRDLSDAAHRARTDGGLVWVGLHDPQADEIDEVVRVFDLHPLAVEDLIVGRQRPKTERYDDWLFVVVKTAEYLDEPETVVFGEIQLLCNDHAIIVIRRGDPVPLTGIRSRMTSEPQRCGDGPVVIVHAVVDLVVDEYERVLNGLDDDISEVEMDVFAPDQRARNAALIERMYFLQREVLQFHRAMNPLVAAMSALRDDPLVSEAEEWDAYFRDVDDHLLRQVDQLHTIRELIGSALDANTAQVSLRQNDDMRKISAWVAIAAVPTMIAGIYGMNFDDMPELDWTFGYPFVLTVMAAASLALHRAFRRNDWL